MIKISFIATREPEYSRVSIVRSELQKHFDVDEYVSGLSSYKLRLLVLAIRLIWSRITGRLKKSDAVFVGFFAQPIFPLVRFLYRGPIIADAYFSLFDTMVNDKKKTRATSIVGRTCFWLDQHMLRHAEMCFTDTDQHVQYLRATFSPDADVRRLWISAESKALAESPPSLAKEQPFEVFFWGGFIPLQGVDTIVRAAGLLKNENVQFTIFGAGQTFAECLQLKSELAVSNLHFAGWQSPDLIAGQAAKSHIALGIFGTTEKAARVIPNKAFEALAMGIPLITRRSPAVDELLEDDVNCLLVDSGDPEQLSQKILWARNNYSAVNEIARRGQERFADCCSPVAIGETMHREILSIIAPESASEESVSESSTSVSENTGASTPAVALPSFPDLASDNLVNDNLANDPCFTNPTNAAGQ